jgi:hypothetical protein
MTRSLTAAMLVVAGLALPASASAAELIVAQARNIGYAPGAKIDSAHVITLKEGQHLTLISPKGDTIALDGPFTGAPLSAGNGNGIMTTLAALTGGNRRYGEVGTTRGTQLNALPSPWLLDVSRSGKVCLLDGSHPVLWRPAADSDNEIQITPADQSWKAKMTWPAKQDQLPVATQIVLHDGVTYLVDELGNQNAISVDLVPSPLQTPEARAAFMAVRGCEEQAEAIVRTIK